jgi:hypothetical protein
MTTSTDTRLAKLGDALERAAVGDLRAAQGRRRRRRVVLGVVAAAVLVPGAAIGASQLLSDEDVARSLPQGTRMLIGTSPTCTAVRANVEYDCTLATIPVGEIERGQFKGAAEPTVDDSKHVNGGCRAQDADGRHWRCYIGQEAVRQQIIGPDFLGEYAPAPGVG